MNKNSLSETEGGRAGWLGLLLTCITGLLLTFWLPTEFSPPPAASDSYLFGFSNHLCQLIFAGFLIAVAVQTKVCRVSYPLPSRLAVLGNGGLNVRLIVVCLAIGGLLCTAFYWLAYGVGGLFDGVYFLDRIHLMVRGQVPFRDFEFIYGSGPLYASIYLARIFHISPDNGYYLIWAIGTVLGIYLLWLSIRWLDLPAGGKRTTFILFYLLLLLLIPQVAINYSAPRYTLPLFAITGLCRIDRSPHSSTRIAVILFTAIMVAVLLIFSPEEGLVYAIASCLYIPIRRYSLHRPFALDTGILIVSVLGLCGIAAHAGTFATMRRLASGAYNLPIYPGPHVLFAFTAILALIIYVAPRVKREYLKSNVIFCIIYSCGMLPGALGRCDSIHVAGYLLPALVCAMLLSNLWPNAARLGTIGFSTFFIMLPFLIGLWWAPATMSKAFLNHLYRGGAPHGRVAMAIDNLGSRLAIMTLGQQIGARKMNALRNSAMATSVDPHQIFPQASSMIQVPFEYRPNRLSNYQVPWINEGYFMGTLNILSSDDAGRKLDELRSHPEDDLLISPDDLAQCKPMRGNPIFMEQLLMLPWVPQPKHELPLLVHYCAYLFGHYGVLYPPSAATFGYGLMRRQSKD